MTKHPTRDHTEVGALQTSLTKLTARVTALEKVLTAPAPVAEPWLVQVIFIEKLDAIHPTKGRITATLSAEGKTRNLAALQGLQARLDTEAGPGHFTVRIDHRGPLTSVTPHGDAAWASIDDVRQWIDPAASIILTSYEIDDDNNPGLSLNGYGGLGYFNNGIAYGAVPAWDGLQSYILDMWGINPYLHEALHGVCGFFASKGIPMPELHEPGQYGFGGDTPTSNEWYRAILGGKVPYRSGLPLTGGSPLPADGALIGCTPAAWKAGRPRYG